MSRWSRRSQEEKDAIAQKLESEKQNKVKKEHPFSSENITDIYEQGEIPLFCHRCVRLVTSDKYEITKNDVPLIGKNANVIRGKCNRCGFSLEQPFPGTPEVMMLFALNVNKLKQSGRLEDKR